MSMITMLFKLLLYKLFYIIGFPRLLPLSYTISLSYACNSNCNTCNISTQKVKDFTLEEYKQLFTSLGKSPYWVTFSGGEPFLKKNIVNIVTTFYDYCSPKVINIPTNGILTDKIVKSAIAICEHCPKSNVVINISIDGVGEQHDQIRNVEGNYQKALSTLHKLKKLNLKNLSVGIHTVISKYNVDSFASIASTLINLNPDHYITEIAEERNELKTIGMDITPNLINYKAAVDFLIHRIKHTKLKKRMAKITQSFRIEYYNLMKEMMRDQKQIISCYSGIISAQISPDGHVWTCCIKAKSIGSLRKCNYDFRKIWKSKYMRNELKNIKRNKCFCPLANAAYTNMLLDFKILYRVFYRSYIKWWR